VTRGTEDQGPIRFAERVLALLDRGSFVATYKYAVLLGLMDLCLEGTSREGVPPDMVTTRQLAEKVVQLYWPQTMPFFASKRGKVLKQNTGNQAKILSDIVKFREGLRVNLASLTEARLSDRDGYERLVRDVEWTLILMPLPRVQVIGRREERVLYDIAWDLSIERSKRLVTQYQRTGGGPFDNRIMLKPRVSEYLVMLNGLLRPLVHREWVRMVAQINKMEEARLESFLFGADRVSMAAASTARSRWADTPRWTTSSRGRATPTTASTTWWWRTGRATGTSATFWRRAGTCRGGPSATPRVRRALGFLVSSRRSRGGTRIASRPWGWRGGSI